MSAAPQMCENPCETCAKEGLPLLLTRYALMPAKTGAPKLSGTLAASELSKVPLGATAHYGLRLLRSGYVYVFDEARKHWDEYFATADGFLSKMPPRVLAFKVQAKPATEFRCARNGAAPLAGVLTIRNPKHATKVWITFSNVEWTQAIFKNHESEAHRQRHMRCITISGGKVAPQPNTAPLEELSAHVTEFRMEQISAAKAFAKWCPHQYNGRQQASEALIKAAQAIRPGGGAAIVALHDPVGLALEIAALAETRKQLFMNNSSVAKPRFAASTIAMLEASVKDQAKTAEVIAGEELAQREEAGPIYASNPALWSDYASGDSELAERWRTHTPEQLDRVATKKWHQYTHDRTGKARIDYLGSQQWLKSYNDDFVKFDRENIAPLAKAHVAWMTHACMISHMSCNHDSADKASGIVYTATVAELLKFTNDKQPSYDQYLAWLKSGEFSPKNLVMRALAFNQDELVAAIEKADATVVDYRAFPSDAVAGAVSSFMDKMPEAYMVGFSALVAGLNGPALKYWDEFNAGRVGSKAAAALAAVSGRQFVRVPVVGTRGDFVQTFMQHIMTIDPSLKANPNQLGKAVAAQVKLLEIEGVKMNAKSKLGWYVLLDKNVIRGASTSQLAGQALANQVAKAIQKPADIRLLDEAKALRVSGRISLGATALGGLLMALNYTKLADDVTQGMSHEVQEASMRLHAGKIAIIGFAVEKLGDGLEKLGERRLSNAAGISTSILPAAMKFTGRLAGLGAGLFLGGLDISRGRNELRSGDATGLANAYFASGAIGVGISVAFFTASMGWIVMGPIGWIIAGIALAGLLLITLYIELSKDNKLQEWLARCHFGVSPEKYGSADVQQEQLRLAFT